MGVIRGKNRKGRSVTVTIYDLQGGTIPREVQDKLEETLQQFLDSHPWGKTFALTMSTE